MRQTVINNYEKHSDCSHHLEIRFSFHTNWLFLCKSRKNKLDNKELFELNTSFNIEEKDLICLVESNRMNNITIKKFLELLK